jgi:hypothetical protein
MIEQTREEYYYERYCAFVDILGFASLVEGLSGEKPSARGAPQEAHRSLPVRWNHLRVAKFTCCRSDPVRPTRS